MFGLKQKEKKIIIPDKIFQEYILVWKEGLHTKIIHIEQNQKLYYQKYIFSLNTCTI